MKEKIRGYIKDAVKKFFNDFGLNYRTVYKVILILVVALYLGLFIWDWKETGKPNLPELRSFAMIIGGWAF